MKYALVTFGCRVNQADSFAIERDLLERGAAAARPEQADVVVVNTCSVTASADQGARQTIRRIARVNPLAKIVVTGCYATRRPAEIEALPGVTAVIRNADKDALVASMTEATGLSTAERFAGGDGPCGSTLTPGAAGRTALALRVQTGCEEQCSYCIIPQTRGGSRSRPLTAVSADVERAVAAGYKEIWITGVHLGSYGRDLSSPTSLDALVEHLAAARGDVLFRISSLEPMDCTREIVERVADSPRLAPHFHLPLQHGADPMLRAMRRPYSVRYYSDLVEYIRRRLPHASIGSDVIVGFPGETDAHFATLRARLGEMPLTYLHVFPYSDRPGTEASRLAGRVDGARIRVRGAEIRAMGAAMTRRFRESMAGSSRRALTVDDGASAVTDNYLKVGLSEARPRNSWVTVVIGAPADAVARVVPPAGLPAA